MKRKRLGILGVPESSAALRIRLFLSLISRVNSAEERPGIGLRIVKFYGQTTALWLKERGGPKRFRNRTR